MNGLESEIRLGYCGRVEDEMLGSILLSMHNLHFLIDLMRRARAAALAGAYDEFLADWMASPAAKDY